MKRTAIKRTVPLCRRTRMRRVNRSRLSKRRAVQFGPQAAWCRESLCVGCRSPGSDPHHVQSRGAGGTDRDCVPLCRPCHTELHTVGRARWEAERHVSLTAVLIWLRKRFYPDRP